MDIVVALKEPHPIHQLSPFATSLNRRSQHTFVTFCGDDRWAVLPPPPRVRTSSSFDWRRATNQVSTSASPDQAARIAVVTNLGTPIIPMQIGAEDRIPFMLATVKRITGWSWDRVAEAMSCSRQSLHGWTLGKDISEPNRERLAKLYATLSYIDVGNIDQNRNFLHIPSNDGQIVADLLNSCKFEDVRRIFGHSNTAKNFTNRSKFNAEVRQNDVKTHWFERLSEPCLDNEQESKSLSPAIRKRANIHRRG